MSKKCLACTGIASRAYKIVRRIRTWTKATLECNIGSPVDDGLSMPVSVALKTTYNNVLAAIGPNWSTPTLVDSPTEQYTDEQFLNPRPAPVPVKPFLCEEPYFQIQEDKPFSTGHAHLFIPHYHLLRAGTERQQVSFDTWKTSNPVIGLAL